MTSEPTTTPCPYLGLPGDRATHFAFPHDAHTCYALRKDARIEIRQQEVYCFTARHPECQRYQVAHDASSDRPKATPKTEARAGRSPAKSRLPFALKPRATSEDSSTRSRSSLERAPNPDPMGGATALSQAQGVEAAGRRLPGSVAALVILVGAIWLVALVALLLQGPTS